MITLSTVHALFLPQIRDLLNRQNIFGLFSLATIEALIISAVMSVPISLFAAKKDRDTTS
jgi:hypothetical protein